MTESDLYPRAMLIATERGDRLFRNNVGLFKTLNHECPECAKRKDDVRYVRTGLCVGSSDLIGWRSVTITPDMVGMTIAQFVGLEAKKARKNPTTEQLAFAKTLNLAGGLASVVRTEEDVLLCLNTPIQNARDNTRQK